MAYIDSSGKIHRSPLSTHDIASQNTDVIQGLQKQVVEMKTGITAMLNRIQYLENQIQNLNNLIGALHPEEF